MTWENQTEKENIQAGEDKVIQEGNRLIAEFMGAKIHDNWGEYLDSTYYKKHMLTASSVLKGVKLTAEQEQGNKKIEAANLWEPKYHSSWDWLMPVLNKLGNAPHDKDSGRLWDDIVDFGLATINIKLTYELAIKFIKWYNSQLKAENK